MNTTEATQFMVRIPLDGQRLFEFARRRRLPAWDLDLGYAAHCALTELFGALTPKPFALLPSTGRVQPVLGYCTSDAEALRAQAQLGADPWLWQHLVEWRDLAAKPMPNTWRVGQRLGFSVRACPVSRAMRAHPKHVKGAEVDVYLLRCRAMEGEPAPSRDEVYQDWFRAQFTRFAGAQLDAVGIEGFQIERLARRDHPRDVRTTLKGRPDVTFRGALTVTDPAAFKALLTRGVGRHRAFGFGMLLLAPP